jgi:uncharacterized SAM-binding protein YcdF (DUF218 family)
MRRLSGRIRAVLWIVLFVLVAGGAWCGWVYWQILAYASIDQAAPSDAIAVFGAAEYDGHPSPVFRARLDHAHNLFDHGIAPLIITLGGDGGDEHSEGAVGREYLMGAGIPESAIIAETQSRSTSESARRIAVIVSDDTHMFRIHQICAANGLNVLTSPRPRVGPETAPQDTEAMEHEILTYTLWRLHLD